MSELTRRRAPDEDIPEESWKNNSYRKYNVIIIIKYRMADTDRGEYSIETIDHALLDMF